MLTTLLIARLLLSSPEQAIDSVEDDTDFLAPFLGLTLLDAEDLAEDAADPPAPTHERPRGGGRRSIAAPAWSALLPNVSVSLVQREARLISGTDGFGIRNGTLFLVQATFGVAEMPAPARPDKGFRLASTNELPLGTETVPVLPPEPGEPSIAEAQEAAERVALVHLQDLTDWRSRARNSAWLPEVSVDYRRNVGEIDTLGIRSDLGIDSHNIEDVTRYGARASWQLSQLVFSREEVGAAEAELQVQQSRQELVAHVTELYFQRVRVRVKLARGGREEEGAQTTLAELTAKLDALTGGLFSSRARAHAVEELP